MTTNDSSPSALVQELHRIPEADALALVDQHFGPPEGWPSELIAYRLGSSFQTDWKIELGQWLKAADQHGFLEKVMKDVRDQAKRPVKHQTSGIDPNDRRHLKLHHHLAVARIVHYLTATGWSFKSIESETGGPIDIDCSLIAPGNQLVEFQVKAPDRPGRRDGYHHVDGDNDKDVIKAVDKARKQLRNPATGPALVGICANRSRSLAWEPDCLITHLVGSTIETRRGVFLEKARTGEFFTDKWKHVSGLLLIDLLRGEVEAKYTCTVLANPLATFPISPEWFPKGRVCVLDDKTFRWIRGQPGIRHGLSNGVQLVEQLP
ncbi:hypothetical protein [Archangium lansingense]|uniref:Restriction endonuclease n=1 Tax=Archangium lansingense TaxID=2995310 RepID=A0ABT4A530_9BACT|nr:hypothetical protein [Archangium lansinium]MCY1076354.1 hypothetical protein [Archangium lansinium]